MLANDTEQWPGHHPVGQTNTLPDNEILNLNDAIAGLVGNDSFPNWNGSYLNSISQDPWESNYFYDPDYKINGTDFAVVGSFGPDKCCNNAYNSDDVYIILSTN